MQSTIRAEYGGESFESETWHDVMDIESVVQYGLEEDDDMNEVEAAFMRGYLEDDTDHDLKKETKQVPVTMPEDLFLDIVVEEAAA